MPTRVPEKPPVITDDDKLPVVVELSHLERKLVSGTELSVRLEKAEYTEPGHYFVVLRANDYFDYQELDWLDNTFIRTLRFFIGSETSACSYLRDGKPCEAIFTVELSRTRPDIDSTKIISPPPEEPELALVNLPTVIQELKKSDEYIAVQYNWEYKGEWSWEVRIPQDLYEYYKKLPRLPTNNYSVYATHPLDDRYIDTLGDKIKNAAKEKGFNTYETVEFAACFVQSLPYTLDSVTTPFDEYPRYPIETLVERGGDCEDTSILLASLITELGYGAILIMLPDHCGVGVKGKDSIPGVFWEYDGDKYYYIESTGSGWGIGDLPEEYKNSKARVRPIIPVPILTHDGTVSGSGYNAEVEIVVSNLGTAPAYNVSVLAGFDAGDNKAWNASKSDLFTVGANEQVIIKLNVRIPLNKYTRLVIQIAQDDILVSESHTNWFNTSGR
ncbi:hypothetical protein ACFLX3_00320 [Chloroflexota bacterium]